MVNSQKIIPIILSGGFGTRLWPLSRQQMPKQFLNNLIDDETLFAKALKITSNRDIFLPSIAVTHRDHKFLVQEQYQNLNITPQSIILEPEAKNTAMAIICACLKAIGKSYSSNDDVASWNEIEKNEQIRLLILPCDHLIFPQNLFEQSIINAMEVVEDKIVTFGVSPTFASTGYGYIKKSNNISVNCFDIDKFIEKPNQENADKFIQDNNYLWNAGIFLLKADILLQEAQKYLPKQFEAAKIAIQNCKQDGVFSQINSEDYNDIDDISIDYGILEKTKNIAITIMKANWSDVGDFNSIHSVQKKDNNGNVTKGNVLLYDSKNSLIKSENNLIACLSLNNIIAIQTDDCILIADKNKSQDVKKITKDLLAQNKNEVKFHNRVHRPWGYYETIKNGENFKIKKISVNSGASLSLQSHEFRSEHWVVINGTATIEKEGEIFDLLEGQSTFIPIKHKHRLSNNTKDEVRIIEVQMGEKVEESDITRYEDNYGRK